jgi:YegS/Rv2252/BmrU family lipid kinase
MNPIKIILNPTAGRGYGARVEPKIRQLLEAERVEFDLVRTTSPWHAAELAERAANDGFETIVAAGGDGTTNEVVNGLMAAAKGGIDFANTVNVPPDLPGACRRLAYGQTRTVDVCRVKVDDQPPRYFDNTVNVGFGGIVTREARKVRWLRGTPLYLLAVLKTIFLYHQVNPTTITCDGQENFVPMMMTTVANGPREGGGFHVAPEARPDDGLFDLCIVEEIGRAAMLGLIPYFLQGTHVGRKHITMARARRVIISSPDGLTAHADGEMLCTAAHRLEFELLPRRLRVLC